MCQVLGFGQVSRRTRVCSATVVIYSVTSSTGCRWREPTPLQEHDLSLYTQRY